MTRWTKPNRSASSRAVTRCSSARDGESAVTASARRPSTWCARTARYALSTPPLKATTSEPRLARMSSRCRCLRSRSVTMRGLLLPILFFLRCQIQLQRRQPYDLELDTALRTTDDLAFVDVVFV